MKSASTFGGRKDSFTSPRGPASRRALAGADGRGTGAGAGAGAAAAAAAAAAADDDRLPGGAPSPARRKNASTMGFGRRSGAAPVPTDIPELLNGVKVDVHVRCRPMFPEEVKSGDKVVLKVLEEEAGVKIKAMGAHAGTDSYWYDNTFGATATQEHVYKMTAKPIVDNVMKGMNCCMFAYGQTGTGKTHTMMGDIHSEANMGIIPRAVRDMFDQLRARKSPFLVKASFLEVYNEQLTDLLIRPEAALPLKLVEDPHRGVVCQNLTEVPVRDIEEVLALVATGNRRCQIAATNINNRSNRAHRIFIITTQFSKHTILNKGSDAADTIIAQATNTQKQHMSEFGCLTLVDLAGSECVGRSGATDGRLIEAGNINKSLLTLGRVINALANNEPRIPYRDSKLTRLTAEALGGKCKTVIIATVAPGALSAMESSSTLKYAERARSALNATQLSKSQVLEAKLARLSELYLDLQDEMKQNLQAFEQERRLVQRTHDHKIAVLKEEHRAELQVMVDSRDAALKKQTQSMQAIRETEDSFLHTARTSSSALESMLLKDLQGLSGQVDALSGSIDSWNEVNSARMCSSGDSVAKLVQHLSARLSELSTSVKGLVTTNVKVLQRQQKVMEAFAAAEMDAMRETSEDMIHRLAKVMSRHAKSHAQRVEEAMAGVLSSNAQLTADTSKIHSITSNMTSDVADSVVKWSQTTTEDLVTLGKDAEKEAAKTSDQIHGIKGSLRVMKSSMTGKLRELYSATVHHHARVDSEAASTAALSKAELENVPHVLKTPTEEELAAQEAAELAAREAEAAKESAAERQHRERRSTASGATVRQVHMGICPTSRMRKDAAGAAPGMKLQQPPRHHKLRAGSFEGTSQLLSPGAASHRSSFGSVKAASPASVSSTGRTTVVHKAVSSTDAVKEEQAEEEAAVAEQEQQQEEAVLLPVDAEAGAVAVDAVVVDGDDVDDGDDTDGDDTDLEAEELSALSALVAPLEPVVADGDDNPATVDASALAAAANDAEVEAATDIEPATGAATDAVAATDADADGGEEADADPAGDVPDSSQASLDKLSDLAAALSEQARTVRRPTRLSQ